MRYHSFYKANNKGADQSARMRRLVYAFVVWKPPKTGFLSSRSILCQPATWNISIFKPVSVAEQTGTCMSLYRPQTPKTVLPRRRQNPEDTIGRVSEMNNKIWIIRYLSENKMFIVFSIVRFCTYRSLHTCRFVVCWWSENVFLFFLVKQFWSRLGPAFCRAWSGSKLLANVLNRRKK